MKKPSKFDWTNQQKLPEIMKSNQSKLRILKSLRNYSQIAFKLYNQSMPKMKKKWVNHLLMSNKFKTVLTLLST